jgi:hypothetical protein
VIFDRVALTGFDRGLIGKSGLEIDPFKTIVVFRWVLKCNTWVGSSSLKVKSNHQTFALDQTNRDKQKTHHDLGPLEHLGPADLLNFGDIATLVDSITFRGVVVSVTISLHQVRQVLVNWIQGECLVGLFGDGGTSICCDILGLQHVLGQRKFLYKTKIST